MGNLSNNLSLQSLALLVPSCATYLMSASCRPAVDRNTRVLFQYLINSSV